MERIDGYGLALISPNAFTRMIYTSIIEIIALQAQTRDVSVNGHETRWMVHVIRN